MGTKTGIEWTNGGSTWTPIRARVETAAGMRVGWHCEHVSEGCRNCYAENFNLRLGTGRDYKPGELRNGVELYLDEKMFTTPLIWRQPRMIFVCSMTDIFADFVPDEWIDRVFAVMALCPQHTFQVLTKRPERMRDYLKNSATTGRIARVLIDKCMIERVWPMPLRHGDIWPVLSIGDIDHPDDVTMEAWPLLNVWLGTSVEDQATADERIPHLLATPAAKRFISAEPLLGPIDLMRIEAVPDTLDKAGRLKRCGIRINALTGTYLESGVNYPDDRLNWVIVGGESGRGARPMHPDWVRSLRDQCAAAEVPFFFKQWGAWVSVSEEAGSGPHFHFEDGATVRRVGKKAAGAMIDGREHREFPR